MEDIDIELELFNDALASNIDSHTVISHYTDELKDKINNQFKAINKKGLNQEAIINYTPRGPKW